MKAFASLIAASGMLFAFSAQAQDCAATIESNDMLQFNMKEITASADCSEFTLTLKHVGQLPKQSMGHNWVLTPAEGWQGIAQAGMQAGIDKEYVPENDAVIAATKLIGGGEETSVTFSMEGLDAGGDYQFFCSFPGHFAVMNGKFIVQ